MGLYDEFTFENGHPECGVTIGEVCQSKSLYAGGGVFTITGDGKLVEQLFALNMLPGMFWEPASRPVK